MHAPAPPVSAIPVDVAGRHLTLTNLDKVLYPVAGFTKAQVVDYYARIGEWMLPHLAGRALTLVRCPNGVDGQRFFEKRCPPHHPDWIPAVGELRSCEVRELAALVWLANLAALELHTLQARADRPERPTAMVLDLDPGPPAGILDCCRVALELRALLEELGLESFVKATGGKGLHVVLPIRPRYGWEEIKGFTRAIAQLMVERRPGAYTAILAKKARRGRIFVDYLRNQRGATAVAAYSARARANAPVAAPLSWQEVEAGIRSDAFTIATLPQRLAALKRDPWQGIDEARQSLPSSLMRKLAVA